MITNEDCILLLSEINDDKANDLITTLASTGEISMEALKYIHSKRPLEIVNFYEHIRKSYNQKHSKLYINIVGGIKKPSEVMTTLSALLTQILLYSNNVKDDKVTFLKHARAKDITKVINNYLTTYDLTMANNLLKLIKADLLALEYINGRRAE